MSGPKGTKDNRDTGQKDGGASKLFGEIASRTSQAAGRALTFMIAAAVVLVWAVTGPIFQYSDTWQLVINTGTTIVTFLMVFLIQRSQNKDSLAIHLKLNELVAAVGMLAQQIVRRALVCIRSDQRDDRIRQNQKIRPATDAVNGISRRGIPAIEMSSGSRSQMPARGKS
jgi:low affinity Fe/Cu permease